MPSFPLFIDSLFISYLITSPHLLRISHRHPKGEQSFPTWVRTLPAALVVEPEKYNYNRSWVVVVVEDLGKL